MNWLNIETATLDSEKFIGSEPVARATWLCLLRYCAGQENGGVIIGCKTWGDRKWQQLARVTQQEVLGESPLWSWQGDDLYLWAYPADKETEVQHRRERARTNGQRGGRPANNPSQEQKKPTSETDAKPTLVHFAKAKEKRREEKRIEEKEKRIAPDGAPLVLENTPETVVKPKRERDPIMDALATVGGGKPEEVTNWGPAIAAKAAIVAVTPDVTADEIRRRARNYPTHFAEAALTPTALAKHWAVCAAVRINVKGRTGIDQAERERAEAGGAFAWEQKGGF